MKKLNPDLYVEAFGVVFRKVVKDDCRKTLASILSKQQEKELIETLFQPAIEMMDACAEMVRQLRSNNMEGALEAYPGVKETYETVCAAINSMEDMGG